MIAERKKYDPVIKVLDWDWRELDFPLYSPINLSLTLDKSLCLRSPSAKKGRFPMSWWGYNNKCVGHGGAPQSHSNGDQRVNRNCRDHQESRTVIMVKDTGTCSALVIDDTESLRVRMKGSSCLHCFNLTCDYNLNVILQNTVDIDTQWKESYAFFILTVKKLEFYCNVCRKSRTNYHSSFFYNYFSLHCGACAWN